MNQVRIVVGIIIIIISYFFFLLSLMRVFPLWIAAPALFVGLVFTLSPLATQKRFKGFHK
ncbi:hypothetical protein [Halalkalibacter alkaliphilus]|uniref:Uncharacterized protein n=1 Tax=Halalkalibacter alkaliphilus TaxID=2917993 RepID=A0A9X2CVM3_9BACI|nr:hypothetical protein [Halalkalibacter alkaliphilus]MCL7749145.1 hypothetical protein [Halalkalibacter alkaliphilus]